MFCLQSEIWKKNTIKLPKFSSTPLESLLAAWDRIWGKSRSIQHLEMITMNVLLADYFYFLIITDYFIHSNSVRCASFEIHCMSHRHFSVWVCETNTIHCLNAETILTFENSRLKVSVQSQRVRMETSSQDYRSILCQFKKTMRKGDILSIERIQNLKLWRFFILYVCLYLLYQCSSHSICI